MANITYGREKGRPWWVRVKAGVNVAVWEGADIPEEHMRLIAILNLAENNVRIPGVGMRSDAVLPNFVRYIIEVDDAGV